MNRFLCLISIFASVSLFSCEGSKKLPKKDLVVKTAFVASNTSDITKKFTIIAQPHHETNLSFRISGPVSDLKVYPGNYFKKGDVIAEIDARDYIIKQERAKGVYDQSKAEYERIKILFDKGNISASTYDKTLADYVSAKSNYESASNDLHDTKLIAPYNGYVDKVYVEQHQDVKAAQSIISLVDIDNLKIEAYVDQEIALRAGAKDQIKVVFDALPNRVFTAKVVDVSKNTTNNNLSYLLTALLPNSDGSLLPGMSGSVVFDRDGSSSEIITVPQVAVSSRPTVGEYVWCIKDGKAYRQKIISGNVNANSAVEIIDGLSIGDEVAITGLRFLSDGLKVEVVR